MGKTKNVAEVQTNEKPEEKKEQATKAMASRENEMESKMDDSQAGADPKPMKIAAHITSVITDPSSNIRAYACISINDAFVVKGIKVVNSHNGLFVAMPSYKSGDEFKDLVYPTTKELRKQITDAVKEVYEIALNMEAMKNPEAVNKPVPTCINQGQ